MGRSVFPILITLRAGVLLIGALILLFSNYPILETLQKSGEFGAIFHTNASFTEH